LNLFILFTGQPDFINLLASVVTKQFLAIYTLIILEHTKSAMAGGDIGVINM
jgi:hypothetical protein